MKKNLFVASLAVAVSFASCNLPEDDVLEPDLEKIPINLSMDVRTKATDSEFETGDKVGVYVVNMDGNAPGTLLSTGNHYDNVCMTKSATGWNLSEQMFWLNKETPAEFYCYYPYDETVSDVNAYPLSVASDQSNESAYYASDFLWGKTELIGPQSSIVNVSVSHMMSCINMEIYGGGFDSFKINEVTINNVKTSGTIDLATGKVTPTLSGSTTVTPCPDGDYSDCRAIILPQTVSYYEIVVYVNYVRYVFSGSSFTFEPGVMYDFSIKVENSTQSLSASIKSWSIKDGYGGYAQ